MSLHSKRVWLFPAGLVTSVSPLLGAAFFAREALICAELGQASAARGWVVWVLACVALAGFWAWGLATIALQELTEHGAQALTLRRGRTFMPWSTVKTASLTTSGARLQSDTVRIRVGFVMYRDPAAAAIFVRSKLPVEATKGR